MTPRRVAYVVNCFPKLSETFVLNELVELRKRGIEVSVLSLRGPTEELAHELVEDLAEAVVYDVDDFRRRLRSFEPDLVHAHFATEPTATALVLARELRVPCTFTAHGYDVYRRPPVDLGRRAAKAAAVLTVSDANAQHLEVKHGVDQSRVAVLPCGVDTDRFRPAVSSPNRVPVLVCVARLVPVKNIDLLLESCGMLRAAGLEFRCVVVGDGRDRERLVALRDELGLGDVVEFVGAERQSAVLDRWRSATIGVLTSDSEGMPLSLMEAGACAVPAVATSVGGVPELIDDGITGLLAPAGDVSAVACALTSLLRDRELARRLGAAARGRIVERFSLRRQVDGLLSVWAEVLAT